MSNKNEPPRVAQLTREQLKSMTQDEIAEAHEKGNLDELLGRRPPVDFDQLDGR